MTPLWLSFLLSLLLLGSMVGFIVGAMLLLRPQSLHTLNQAANRWISTRSIEKPLEKMILIDHWFYQHRRISGAFMGLGGILIIVFCTSDFDRPQALATLRSLNPAISPLQLDALVLICLMGAVFAVLVSLFLMFRPSLLRDFEQGANQWVSLRHAIKPLEVQHTLLDQYVFNHFRVAGTLLLCGSLYGLLALTFWLL